MNVNIGYAWEQLLEARRTAAEHPDARVRARAQQAVAKWQAVIAGMQDGSITVGSRTPTEAPVWVTLEVVTGGFATGGYSAGGPLLEHEAALAERLGVQPTRVALNLHFLESPDAAELLASGRYRIDVPEEGALLVVALLRERGESARAREVVETLAPWFEILRFYPAPAERAAAETDTVRLQDVGATFDRLAQSRRQQRFDAMRASLLVWKPLYHRALALLIETIDGEPPRMVDGKVTPAVIGARFPDGWHARVDQLVADFTGAGESTLARACHVGNVVRPLQRLARGEAPDESTHNLLRWYIAIQVTHHGLPDSAREADRLEAERAAVRGPVHADVRRVLVERLRASLRDGGIDLDRAAAPITDDESQQFGVAAGTNVPGYMVDKLARSWDAPLEALVEHGVIASSEVLARVLPQMTGRVRAAALDAPAARRLYAAMYSAFRRRRGLLLLDYEHQVRFHELPWVAALEAMRRSDASSAARARGLIERATATVFRGFPHTIVPNKLVPELDALCSAADLKLPLVEELAADIFMGSFTRKFAEAARVTARVVANTIYARYYAIDTHELAGLPSADKLSPEFAALCERRAQLARTRRSVARNGKIIEQSQILTTHNLAVLFDAFELRAGFARDLRPAAEACLRWIVRQLRIPARSGHEVLIRLKNTAYAWRQMVFYLSFVDDTPDFLRWARGQLARTDEPFQQRFEPAIRGLELAASGTASSDPAFSTSGGRVFTGWSTERHWLSP